MWAVDEFPARVKAKDCQKKKKTLLVIEQAINQWPC